MHPVYDERWKIMMDIFEKYGKNCYGMNFYFSNYLRGKASREGLVLT